MPVAASGAEPVVKAVVRPRVLLVWQIACIVPVWLSILEWPLPPMGDLDPSWQQALVDAWLHERQFGKEFIFTWGPWGALLMRFVLPDAVAYRIVFEVLGKLALVVMLVRFVAPLAIWRQALFLATVAVLCPIFPDATLLIGTVALISLVIAATSARWMLVAASGALAFLSLVKFSNAALAALGVVVAVSALVVGGRRRQALTVMGTYASAIVLLWVAAGQALVHLSDFIATSAEMARGYAAAMSLEESWPVFAAGVALLALDLTCVAWHSLLRPGLAVNWPTAIVMGASIVLAWKHGFSRADGHVMGFFIFSMLIVCTLPAMLSRTVSRWWWLAAIYLVALVGLGLAAPALLQASPAWTLDRVRTNARVLWNIDAVRVDFNAGLAHQRQAWQLQRASKVVGDDTIDVFGHEQGLVYLNDLNYTPRPVPQGYATYTSALLERNRRFVASDDAPQYILARLSAIDGRYPAQEDASALAELPRRYAPVLHEREHVLLSRRQVQPPDVPLALTPLLGMVIRAGEEFDLPSGSRHPLWLQVEAFSTLRGLLRELLYKPAPLFIDLTDAAGVMLPFRLIPTIAESGFVVHPLLTNTVDLAAFVEGRVVRAARSVRIRAAAGQELYWGNVRIIVSQVDDVTLRTRAAVSPDGN